MIQRFLLPVFFLLNISVASAQYVWTLRTEKDGIKIFTSPSPASKVKALRVECDFKTTPAQLVAVLMDVKTCADWVYHTKYCTLVKQISESELVYYSEVSLPWPAQNRDFVAHLSVHQDLQTKVVTIDGPAVPGYVPVKDGIVRITHSTGKWLLTPVDHDTVKVIYTLQVDPGGEIPAWLVNMFATEGPLQSFRALKVQLQKPAYQHVAAKYILN